MLIFVVRVSEIVDVYRYTVSSGSLVDTVEMSVALRMSKIAKQNGSKVQWIEG